MSAFIDGAVLEARQRVRMLHARRSEVMRQAMEEWESLPPGGRRVDVVTAMSESTVLLDGLIAKAHGDLRLWEAVRAA